MCSLFPRNFVFIFETSPASEARNSSNMNIVFVISTLLCNLVIKDEGAKYSDMFWQTTQKEAACICKALCQTHFFSVFQKWNKCLFQSPCPFTTDLKSCWLSLQWFSWLWLCFVLRGQQVLVLVLVEEKITHI